MVGHPLRLRVRVPRYRCLSGDCDRKVFSHNTYRLASAHRYPGIAQTCACLPPGHPCLALYDRRVPLPAPGPDARAVVTGASQGIGEALATELAARGHNLIITARREDVLNSLATRLADKYRVAVDVRPGDLADPTQRAKLADELATRTISILCANAGTATLGPVAGLDPAVERAQVQLNVVAVHDLTLAVLPGMIERGAGGILISGSAAGNSPIPNNATYASTKAFLNTFSESLRGELRSSGVHVTLLAPGPVRTGLPDYVDASMVDKLIPDFLWTSAEYTAKVSVGRFGPQQNARRSRHPLEGDVGGQPVRATRHRRADRGQNLQEAGRRVTGYRRRRPVSNMLPVIRGRTRYRRTHSALDRQIP